MKRIIALSVALLLALTACSSDDSTGEQRLKKITKTEYSPGGAIQRVSRIEYKDGKIDDYAYYGDNNIMIGEFFFSYSSNGLLSSHAEKLATAENPFGYGHSYVYDGSGRIIHVKITQEDLPMTTINYTYNSDNTITSVVQSGQDAGTVRTYYLNENNIIYKEVSDSGTYELTLDGNNAVSASLGMFTRTFEYDNEHDPSLLKIVNPMGSYLSNPVLGENSLPGNETASADKYLIKKTLGSDVTEYKYTFNSAGLPVSMSEYLNDKLVSKSEYKY